jgi:hypothetical protein
MVMSVIAALIGLAMLGMAIYASVVTRGGILNEISYFEIAKGICGSIFAVLLMSFYGGIAGGIIMTLAAFVRKRRGTNADSKTA